MSDTKETWEERFDEEFDFFECAALNGVEIKAFIRQEIQEAEARGREKEKKLLDALESMYEQYCHHGHSSMSAGEGASEVMEEYGYTFDGGGRLLNYPAARTGEEVNK